MIRDGKDAMTAIAVNIIAVTQLSFDDKIDVAVCMRKKTLCAVLIQKL